MFDHLFEHASGGHMLPFLWLHGEDHAVIAERSEERRVGKEC